MEGGPNLKVNEKPGFVSLRTPVCTLAGGLVDSPGDWEGVDCTVANGFEPSVELDTPNPTNGVPDELPKENIDDVCPF